MTFYNAWNAFIRGDKGKKLSEQVRNKPVTDPKDLAPNAPILQELLAEHYRKKTKFSQNINPKDTCNTLDLFEKKLNKIFQR